MILQVLPDGRQMAAALDTFFVKRFSIADARKLQQFRRIDRTGRQDDLAPRRKYPLDAILQDLDAGRAPVRRKNQPLRKGTVRDRDISSFQRRAQIFGAGMRAAGRCGC